MMVVNSICGCAAGRTFVLRFELLCRVLRPSKMFSVFADKTKKLTGPRSAATGVSAVVAFDRAASRWETDSRP